MPATTSTGAAAGEAHTKAITLAVTKLASNWDRRRWTAAKFALYVDELLDLPADVVAIVVRQAIRTRGEWDCPTIGTLRMAALAILNREQMLRDNAADRRRLTGPLDPFVVKTIQGCIARLEAKRIAATPAPAVVTDERIPSLLSPSQVGKRKRELAEQARRLATG